MPIANVIGVSHVARETSDIRRLIEFYNEVFGFEEADMDGIIIRSKTKIVWLNHPSSGFQFHFIERYPSVAPRPENPLRSTVAGLDPRSHHISFSVTNFDSALEKLKEKGIKTSVWTSERDHGNDIVKQAFFSDPDGNLLEITNDREVESQSA